MRAALAGDLPAGSHLTGARRRVPRTRSACVWSLCRPGCPAAGTPGRPVAGLEHLISAVRRLSAQRTPV